MLTLRQIERWWSAAAFDRLLDELCAGRAEGVNGIRDLLNGPVAAAAMTIIRAGELRQSGHPHVAKMIQLLLLRQDRLGGWDGAVTTALAARALSQGGATGTAVDAALTRLADLQSADGEWSATTGRAGSDADLPTGTSAGTLTDMAVTAFVLYQLATIRRPAAALLIDGALNRLLAPEAGPVDTQLNTLRRRIEARRVLAPAA